MLDEPNKAKPKIRVFVVDDHPVVRRGFQLLCNMTADLTVCGEADSSPVALEQILTLKPEVVIIDLLLKGGSGLDLIKQIRAQALPTKLLVFTMQDEATYAERALRAGADGYVTKEEGAEEALNAIRLLRGGQRYVTPRVARKLVQRLTAAGSAMEVSIDALSDRELEIFELLGRGLGSRQIAGKLHLSLKTIESHREHIKTKLGLNRSTDLISRAHYWVQARPTA